MTITASAFDLTNGAVVLRLICALFFFPHIYFKVVGNPPPALGFFQKAGYKPALVWMRIAAVFETAAALCLLFAVYTQWAALVAAFFLAVAAVSVCSFNGSVKWLWNLGGMEYCVFWCIACVAVAMLYWN